jgi:hypothetical protein
VHTYELDAIAGRDSVLHSLPMPPWLPLRVSSWRLRGHE